MGSGVRVPSPAPVSSQKISGWYPGGVWRRPGRAASRCAEIGSSTVAPVDCRGARGSGAQPDCCQRSERLSGIELPRAPPAGEGPDVADAGRRIRHGMRSRSAWRGGGRGSLLLRKPRIIHGLASAHPDRSAESWPDRRSVRGTLRFGRAEKRWNERSPMVRATGWALLIRALSATAEGTDVVRLPRTRGFGQRCGLRCSEAPVPWRPDQSRQYDDRNDQYEGVQAHRPSVRPRRGKFTGRCCRPEVSRSVITSLRTRRGIGPACD